MTGRNSVRLVTAILPLFFVPLLCAQTQAAQSFEQLQVLVRPGDKIYVRDGSGVSKGKILALSPTSLELMTKGGIRQLAQSDILEIKQWRNDSLVNGAAAGAGGGLIIGVIGATAVCGEFRNCAGPAAAMIGLFTGLGVGVGVGIDALIPHKRTIYMNGSRASSRFTVSPVLGPSRKGMAVRFLF